VHLLPIVVLKFGSSVLSSVDDMPRVVREIWRHIEQGQRVVAIVSAFAGVTDKLLETLHQVDVKADSYRIADFVSTGAWPFATEETINKAQMPKTIPDLINVVILVSFGIRTSARRHRQSL